MTPETIFLLLLTLVSLNFLWEKGLDNLNAKRFNDKPPHLLKDIYDEEAYQKSQAYKKATHKLSSLSSTFSFLLTLFFFLAHGFAQLHDFVLSITSHPILSSLLYLGILGFVSSVVSLPFDYYSTFVIEEKFGFNKSTVQIFVLDKIKGLFLGGVLGGMVLSVLIWFYQEMGEWFWVYAWVFVCTLSVFLQLFFSSLIVPLFNKQKHLEEGELKKAILEIANKINFKIDNIYVIDGSKRSSKANAYFTGFGPRKRIVLYDTLIHELSKHEVVAVLAHEMGHYKKKHILWNLIMGMAQTGFLLFLFSKIINNERFAHALQIETPSFHIGLIVFGILFSPISHFIGWMMNIVSRKFEYQADDFAKKHSSADDLISSLKKLSRNSLSNLTPHPWYVHINYSHPTLLERIKNLMK